MPATIICDDGSLEIPDGPLSDMPQTTIQASKAAVTLGVRIARSELLKPNQHCNDYYELYELLTKVVPALGITLDQLEDSFAGWTQSMFWRGLTKIEYLFPVYEAAQAISQTLADILVDKRKMIRVINLLYASVLKTSELPDYQSASARLRLMQFFNGEHQNCGWAQFNQATRDKIAILDNNHAECMRMIGCINPHELNLEFIGHAEAACWKSDLIAQHYSEITPKHPGEPVLAPIDDILKRYEKFSGVNVDMMKKLPTGVVFAGGSVAGVIGDTYYPFSLRAADIDMFIYGIDGAERSRIFSELVDWFIEFAGERRCWYAVTGSVVSVYIVGLPRKFQIISVDACYMYDVIGRFDLSHIQFMLVPQTGTIWCTAGAVDALTTGLSRANNTLRIRMERMLKALIRGWDLAHKNLIGIFDITDMVQNYTSADTGKLISKINSVSKVTYDEDLTDNQNRIAQINIIQLDYPHAFITTDPMAAKTATVTSGNFAMNYTPRDFGELEAAVGNVIHIPKRTCCSLTDMHTKRHLVIKITAVKKFLTHPNGNYELTVTPDTKEVREGLQLIDKMVSKFSNGKATTKPIIDGGDVVLSITADQIETVMKHSKDLIVTFKDTPLTFDDLPNGVEMQIFCTVSIITRANEQFARLSVQKIIADVQDTSDDVDEATKKIAEMQIGSAAAAAAVVVDGDLDY